MEKEESFLAQLRKMQENQKSIVCTSEEASEMMKILSKMMLVASEQLNNSVTKL